MTAPFRMDETITIEVQSGATDPDYGTLIDSWSTVASRVWANVQDVLPSRAEVTANALRIGAQRSRLRIRNNAAITAGMRVTLHGKGDRIMQIVAGPALLDDQRHTEFMLESYSS